MKVTGLILDKSENRELINEVLASNPIDNKEKQPWLFDVIF